jgi:hypothetical protein
MLQKSIGKILRDIGTGNTFLNRNLLVQKMRTR